MYFVEILFYENILYIKMSNYLKNEIKHLPMIVVVSIIFCGINTLANNHLFNSKDVDYDNSNTHIESTNVGDAIDELFDAANNFTTYDTRLQGVESKVGTGSLNTTAQNLIGGVNELNGNLTSLTARSITNGNLTANLTGTVNILRVGKFCIVWVNAEATADIDGTQIGTIPSGYRPSVSYTSMKGIVTISGARHIWSGYFGVKATGEIYHTYGSGISNGTIFDLVFAYSIP